MCLVQLVSVTHEVNSERMELHGTPENTVIVCDHSEETLMYSE